MTRNSTRESAITRLTPTRSRRIAQTSLWVLQVHRRAEGGVLVARAAMTISINEAYARVRERMCLSTSFLLGCIDDIRAQLTLLPLTSERESLGRRLAECEEEFARWVSRPASEAGGR